MTSHEANRVLREDLACCRCGRPDDVFEWLQKLLELIDEPRAEEIAFDAWFAEINAHCGNFTIRQAVYAWLDGAELIEHGTSIGSSWLTRKGEDFLEAMKVHGFNAIDKAMEW